MSISWRSVLDRRRKGISAFHPPPRLLPQVSSLLRPGSSGEPISKFCQRAELPIRPSGTKAVVCAFLREIRIEKTTRQVVLRWLRLPRVDESLEWVELSGLEPLTPRLPAFSRHSLHARRCQLMLLSVVR